MSDTPVLAGSMDELVKAEVCSFGCLFGRSSLPFAIDTYQRGFVWGLDKVQQLLTDLRSFCRERQKVPNTPDYYMGTLLLHEDQKARQCFIIDGQQRLTALSILHRHLKGTIPANCRFEFRSVESRQNVQQASIFCREEAAAWPQDLFERLCFTVIRVASEDLAFAFFDTQNNRGVPLHATDLLKAFHLRAIKNPALQKDCAQRWERLQKLPSILGVNGDFAPALFGEFLWRARCWTGNRPHFESHELLLKEFQSRTREGNGSGDIPLFRAQNNQLATALAFNATGGFDLTTRPIRLIASPADLPFAIRQPIYRGVGFFLFAEKYAALAHELLDEKHANPEVRAFQKFYTQVIAELSVYLREIFLLSVLMYVDQFGFNRLLEFALRLDHLIGAVRIHKRYVFRETARNFFRDKPLNLLDVIASAFIPDEIMDCLSHDPEADRQFEESDSVELGRVQQSYKERLLSYYRRTGSLKGKHRWITPDFIADRIKEAARAQLV